VREVKNTSSSLSSALAELSAIRKELDDISSDTTIQDELNALRTEVDQILAQNKVLGMDIYIQATEPATTEDHIWINTDVDFISL
jgi:hypothetical protein